MWLKLVACILGAAIGVILGPLTVPASVEPVNAWPCCSCDDRQPTRRRLGGEDPDKAAADTAQATDHIAISSVLPPSSLPPYWSPPPPSPLPPPPPPPYRPMTPSPPPSPTLASAAWEKAFHPLWMLFSGLYTCWHASRESTLAGLGGVAFVAGIFYSVFSGVYDTLNRERDVAIRADPACCPCTMVEIALTSPLSVVAEIATWLILCLTVLAPLASLAVYYAFAGTGGGVDSRDDSDDNKRATSTDADGLEAPTADGPCQRSGDHAPAEIALESARRPHPRGSADEEWCEPIDTNARDVEAFFSALDADGNDSISFDELMLRVRAEKPSAALRTLTTNAVMLFASMDRNGDGRLSKSEVLFGLATAMGHGAVSDTLFSPSPAEVKQMNAATAAAAVGGGGTVQTRQDAPTIGLPEVETSVNYRSHSQQHHPPQQAALPPPPPIAEHRPIGSAASLQALAAHAASEEASAGRRSSGAKAVSVSRGAGRAPQASQRQSQQVQRPATATASSLSPQRILRSFSSETPPGTRTSFGGSPAASIPAALPPKMPAGTRHVVSRGNGAASSAVLPAAATPSNRTRFTVVFRNSRRGPSSPSPSSPASSCQAAGGRADRPSPHLPPEVHFYVRTRASSLRFPFPPSVDEGAVLHVARVVNTLAASCERGADAALLRGPPADTEPQKQVELRLGSVVGLEREGQPLDAVYISVPSDFSPRLGRWVNPDIEPTELLVNLADQRPSSYGDPGRILVPLKTRARRASGGADGGASPQSRGGAPPSIATMPAEGMARLVG